MIDWRAIDTVLLDMDGTLLDLHFDNYFWLTHLPRRYAEHHNLDANQAMATLEHIFVTKKGTLDWYCLDYWSSQLDMDITALKREIQHLISERPHAIKFLKWLKTSGKRRFLITNAHPESLNLKLSLTGIGSELDTVISSHELKHPKESPLFWECLAEKIHLNPASTLFIDDSISVLQAAEDFGIGYLCGIKEPDSRGQPVDTQHFFAVTHFDEFLPEQQKSTEDSWIK